MSRQNTSIAHTIDLLSQKWNQKNNKNLKIALINKFLSIGVLFILVSYLIFNRGLSFDGSHNLLRMVLNNSFYYLETARHMFYTIQQFPTYIFIKYFSSNSILILVKVFSFGLIWIHIVSLFGCYFILPKNKKYYMFFPLLAFFVGPTTGLAISVSTSLSVFSYIWFTSFVIHYSNLSKKLHKFLFFLAPIPLFLSHELMSYMAWPLIYLCFLKVRIQINAWNKLLIMLTTSFLFVVSISSIFFIFFPEKSEFHNKIEFLKSLFYLEFFLKISNGKIAWIYPSIISSFFLLMQPFEQFLVKKYHQSFSIACSIFVILFGVMAIISPFYHPFDFLNLPNEEIARVWIVIIALPVSLLIWLLYERNEIKLNRCFSVSVLIYALSLLFWRVGSDYKNYNFQKQLAEDISHYKGLINWEQVSGKATDLNHLQLFYLTPYSLFIQNKNNISAVLTLNKKVYKTLHNCFLTYEHNCNLTKIVHCYYECTHNSMCQYFNLQTLDQSRFFNVKPLIQIMNKTLPKL